MKLLFPEKLPLLLLLLSLSLLGACGGGGGGDDPIYLDPEGNPGDLDDRLDDIEDENDNDSGVVDEPSDEELAAREVDITEGNVHLFIPGHALLDEVEPSLETVNLPDALPPGLSQVGDAVNVNMSESDQALLNGTLTLTITYEDADVGDESNLLALLHDGEGFQPVRVVERDADANTVSFQSRGLSRFVLVESDGAEPASYSTGFDPALDAWGIANFGSYFAPGGNSAGMNGYAAWHFANRSEGLAGKYGEETARKVAARAQMAQSETWGVRSWREGQQLSEAEVAFMVRSYLSHFDEPLLLTLGGEFGPERTVLVYAYDTNGFHFYDPEEPGTDQFVGFNGTGFDNYDGLSEYGFMTISVMGNRSDFEGLESEADADFPGSTNIAIDNPEDGEQIDAHETTMSGSFLNELSEETELYVEVKGIGRQLSVPNGNFSNTIEVYHGTNTIVALAGVDASAENNWFQDSPTVLLETEGTLAQTELLVTLTWAQDETDVDLYITEPTGETMWFSNKETANGLTLDFDDTTGFGPEHGTLEVAQSTTVEEVIYHVRVHYFSDDGLDVDATGRVTIVVNEGEPNQDYLTVGFRIGDANSSTAGPDGSGSAWVDIAGVDVENGTIDPDYDPNAEDNP